MNSNKFNSFKEFYPFYLSEHSKKETKILHAIGSILVLLLFFYCILTKDFIKIIYSPIIGYGFAWIAHFIFEKNHSPPRAKNVATASRQHRKQIQFFY